MTDITVPIPDDRVAEFYQFFGLWLAGSLSLSQSPAEMALSPAAVPGASAPTPRHWTEGSPEEAAADAEALWKKFSPNAKSFFKMLMENPGMKWSGDEAASAAGIPNGAHGVAGVLAWPGRFCAPMGRHLPSHWEEDDEGNSFYSMSDEVAAIFVAARDKVEQKG